MVTLDNAQALVVGIAAYQRVQPLPPVADAQDLAALLADPAYCAYPPANVQLLLDEQATGAALRGALADLTARGDEESTVLIYFSGHGGHIASGPHAGAYLLPVDADADDDETLTQTAIAGGEFSEALRRIAARKVVVIFDCCHAGGIGEPRATVRHPFAPGLPEHYLETLQGGRGRVILASSRSSESSWVLHGARYGLFTEHLLAGLRGGAPGPGGVIRIFDLFHYLQPRVTAAQPNQHPIFKAELEENFAIALHADGTVPKLDPVAPPADGFAYDIFLSYRQREPDRAWVRKVLLPRLQANGLRVCVDFRDFRLGAPLVLEMARAVEQSRYTLAVLSPAYLESNFTELENVLAEHLGLERSERRLLAVLREDCTPRLGMRARLWLDMTDDAEFEENVARLAYEVRRAPVA